MAEKQSVEQARYRDGLIMFKASVAAMSCNDTRNISLVEGRIGSLEHKKNLKETINFFFFPPQQDYDPEHNS